LPWIVALATFPLAGLLFLGITGASPVVAAGVGMLAAVVLGLGVRAAFPVDAELESYQADARRRVGKVLACVREIEHMAGRVQDPAAKAALEDGCRRIPPLLDSVQERDPSAVASMAAKLNVTTSGIQTSLTQYLEIQADPDLYTGASDLLATGQAGFKNFQGFVVDTYRQLNDAEIINYKATLAALQPLQIRELTSGTGQAK
jgi:hypothetical protein